VAGEGKVLAWSTGTLLDGQPEMYLDNPNHHEENAKYAMIASFAPFPGGRGVTVATTSTTDGADILVAGVTPAGAEVRKYTLERSTPGATTVDPKLVATLPALPGLTAAAPIGGR
jgi:alcohol dehydrogenase class IV